MRLAFALILLPTLAFAEGTVEPPPEGSVSAEEGAAAWERVHEVVSHPRCANCHVGPDNIPRWAGLGRGPDAPHGMNINAGDSRIGVETMLCSTCHQTAERPNAQDGAPPHVQLDWMLAPVEFQWHGKTSAEICAQMSDPDRTGGRDWIALAEHLAEDAGHGGFVGWAFEPGADREPAPYGLQAHIDDVLAWGAAGQPCPEES